MNKIIVHSEQGKRPYQEDKLGSSYYEDFILLVVADGMGGHKGGAEASELAVKTMLELKPIDDATLFAAVHMTHREVSSLRGGGTTVVAALINNKTNKVSLSHVGDSRAYGLFNENFYQLTEDHNLFEELLKQGSISEKEADDPNSYPKYRCTLTQCLGYPQGGLPIHPSIDEFSIKPGDQLLLATDGLWDVWTNKTLQQKFAELDAKNDLRQFFKAAIDDGSRDNITGILYTH